jgi:hypothetical protein
MPSSTGGVSRAGFGRGRSSSIDIAIFLSCEFQPSHL